MSAVVNGSWRRAGGQFASRTESELEASVARVVDAHAAGAATADAVRAMRAERAQTKLTAAQRRRVREMLADGEAYTRAEAVTWVLQMEGGQ